MKTAIFWVVAILALLFNLFSLYDLVMYTIDFENHLAGYPPAFVEMVANFPGWKRIMWTTTVFIGVIGAAMLVLRRSLAERALWVAAVLLLLGIVVDYAVLEGAEAYGPNGVLFNGIIVAIEAAFALYATHARRQGMLR